MSDSVLLNQVNPELIIRATGRTFILDDEGYVCAWSDLTDGGSAWHYISPSRESGVRHQPLLTPIDAPIRDHGEVTSSLIDNCLVIYVREKSGHQSISSLEQCVTDDVVDRIFLTNPTLKSIWVPQIDRVYRRSAMIDTTSPVVAESQARENLGVFRLRVRDDGRGGTTVRGEYVSVTPTTTEVGDQTCPTETTQVVTSHLTLRFAALYGGIIKYRDEDEYDHHVLKGEASILSALRDHELLAYVVRTIADKNNITGTYNCVVLFPVIANSVRITLSGEQGDYSVNGVGCCLTNPAHGYLDRLERLFFPRHTSAVNSAVPRKGY